MRLSIHPKDKSSDKRENNCKPCDDCDGENSYESALAKILQINAQNPPQQLWWNTAQTLNKDLE